MTTNTLFHNRFRLIERIGQGSFGEVWLANDEQLDMLVAVKAYIALDDRGIEEFKKEYKTAYDLNHPNLLHANHFDICDRRPFLVMPYCPDSALSLIGNCDRDTLWQFIKDVSAGLAYLHSKDIIHHDIKPDNILRTEDGRFVITDFGISTKMRSTLRRNSTRAMNQNTSGGSLPYMGPEMFSTKPESVKATDIWAFGVTLYEIITGVLPFFGQGGVMQLNGAQVPELDYEDLEIVKLVKACMAKNPWDRPTAEAICAGQVHFVFDTDENTKTSTDNRNTQPFGNNQPITPMGMGDHGTEKQLKLLPIAKISIILCIPFASYLAVPIIFEFEGDWIFASIGGLISILGEILMLRRLRSGFWTCCAGYGLLMIAVCEVIERDLYHPYNLPYSLWNFLTVIGFFVLAGIYGILRIKDRSSGLSSWDIMGFDEIYESKYGLFRVKKKGKYGMVYNDKSIAIPIEQDSLSPIMYCNEPWSIPGPIIMAEHRITPTKILGCIFEKGDEKGIYQCKMTTGGITRVELYIKMSKAEWRARECLT